MFFNELANQQRQLLDNIVKIANVAAVFVIAVNTCLTDRFER